MQNLTFITGGARSGKSALAEQLAKSLSKTEEAVIYLATMQVFGDDPEIERRLQIHRSRRPSGWTTIECPFKAGEIINELPSMQEGACVVFDCLSLYLSNMLLASTGGAGSNPYDHEEKILAEISSLIEAIEKRIDLQFIVVSNEVGSGVVPETPLGRAFRDFLGLANQQFATRSSVAYLCAAGIPLKLK